MDFEPLNIADVDFLISRTIEQAPTATLIREFFKNAEENAALAPAGQRKIQIYPVDIKGVRKLAFWNTGVGMSESELKRATNLSSSINKTMALNGNYGIGAKVSGLTLSKEGIRYRSCKNGRVHEVTIGYHRNKKAYGRFVCELPDGSSDSVYDVTNVVQKEGKDVGYDWTEVVLYGESEDHDTIAEPMGKNKESDRSYIPTAIFRRFAKFSEDIEIRIDVAMTKGGGKDETGTFRRLKTLDQVIDEIGLRNQTVKDQDSGVEIRYIHDPRRDNSSHTSSSRANAATASTTFCALVHKGERYDFKTKKAWSSAAPNFGIPFGSKVLTIEILLPDDMALPTQYRDALTNPEDRSPLTIDDFSIWVRELMPEWVKEVIKSESPEANDNLDDLQADLQKLLDEYRIPTVTRTFSKKKEAEQSNNDDGIDSTERVNIDDNDLGQDIVLESREERDNQNMRRANKTKARKAPDGAEASMSSKALERVPQIEILLDQEQIAEKMMKGRAGRYYKDAQTIFVNGLYPVSARMAEELEREFSSEGEPEKIREAVLKASRRSMAFRVGKTVCYAISKKLAEDWTMDDLDKATSPESLSMAADDYRQHISLAKKWIKEQLKLNNIKNAA